MALVRVRLMPIARAEISLSRTAVKLRPCRGAQQVAVKPDQQDRDKQHQIVELVGGGVAIDLDPEDVDVRHRSAGDAARPRLCDDDKVAGQHRHRQSRQAPDTRRAGVKLEARSWSPKRPQ